MKAGPFAASRMRRGGHAASKRRRRRPARSRGSRAAPRTPARAPPAGCARSVQVARQAQRGAAAGEHVEVPARLGPEHHHAARVRADVDDRYGIARPRHGEAQLTRRQGNGPGDGDGQQTTDSAANPGLRSPQRRKRGLPRITVERPEPRTTDNERESTRRTPHRNSRDYFPKNLTSATRLRFRMSPKMCCWMSRS